MKRFEGKGALVTGGAGGIGSAICRVLAEEGANVAVNFLDVKNYAEEAAKLVESISNSYGGDHQCCSADITDENEVKEMVKAIILRFGKIDILVNNAGLWAYAPTWKISAEQWSKLLSVNLTGTLYCSKAVLPGMRKRNYGRIIHISSVAGLQGLPGVIAYASTKAGTIGMCKSMAREVADRSITVNAVAPGYINAGMLKCHSDIAKYINDNDILHTIPMRRMGDAIDIAKAVAFLASDEANYITGEVLRVDGGLGM